MKKLKALWTAWVLRLKAKTPILGVVIRNLGIGIIAAVGVINTTASTSIAPQWYTDYQWYILAGAGLMGLIAQSFKKPTS